MKLKLLGSSLLSVLLIGCDTGASLDNGSSFVSGLSGSLTAQILYDLPVRNLSYVCEPETVDTSTVIEVKRTTDSGFMTCGRGDKTATLFLGQTKENSIEIASFNLIALSNQNAFEKNEQSARVNNVITPVAVQFPINLAKNTNPAIATALEGNIYRIFKSMERTGTQNFLTIPNVAHQNVTARYAGINSQNLSDRETLYNEYLGVVNTALNGNLRNPVLQTSAQANQSLEALTSSVQAGFYQTSAVLDSEISSEILEKPIIAMPGFLTRDKQWRIMGQTINANESLEQGLYDVYLDKDNAPKTVANGDKTQLKEFKFFSNQNSSFVADLGSGEIQFNRYVFGSIDSQSSATISCVGELFDSGLSVSDAEEFCNSELSSDSVGRLTLQDNGATDTYRFNAEKSDFVGTAINLQSGYSYPLFFTMDFVGENAEEEEIVNETASFIINEVGNVYRDLDSDCSVSSSDNLVGIVRQTRTDEPFLTFGILFSDPRQSLYSAFSGFNVGQTSDVLASFALQLNLDTYEVTAPTTSQSADPKAATWNLIFDSEITRGRIENARQTSNCSS